MINSQQQPINDFVTELEDKFQVLAVTPQQFIMCESPGRCIPIYSHSRPPPALPRTSARPHSFSLLRTPRRRIRHRRETPPPPGSPATKHARHEWAAAGCEDARAPEPQTIYHHKHKQSTNIIRIGGEMRRRIAGVIWWRQ